VAEALQEMPMKGSLDRAVPVDPLIYRFHEITQVYGTTMKALIHEMFGDGIMSAIDFEMDIQKVEDPKGDRVVVTYNGKFLPYKKW
jgi:cyanate lyase